MVSLTCLVRPIFEAQMLRNKKGLIVQAFYFNCVALLHVCRKKAFEKNPLLPSGQSLLVSESPIIVGFSDTSRPDFPEYGYRFFQTPTSYTSIAGVSPQQYFIPNPNSKVNKITTNYGNYSKC